MGVPYPLSAAERFITALSDSHPGTPGEWFQFALARRDDGELVEDCAARPGAGDPGVVEIGFSLARGHQSRDTAPRPSGVCSTTCSTTSRGTPCTG
ncbi:MAG: GNAT family N-acetyltransferase [Pseudonocardiaceae bacterium]